MIKARFKAATRQGIGKLRQARLFRFRSKNPGSHGDLPINTIQRRTRLAEEAEGDEGEAAEGTVLRLLARAEVTAATALPTVVDVGLRFRAASAVKCRTYPRTVVARLLPS